MYILCTFNNNKQSRFGGDGECSHNLRIISHFVKWFWLQLLKIGIWRYIIHFAGTLNCSYKWSYYGTTEERNAAVHQSLSPSGSRPLTLDCSISCAYRINNAASVLPIARRDQGRGTRWGPRRESSRSLWRAITLRHPYIVHRTSVSRRDLRNVRHVMSFAISTHHGSSLETGNAITRWESMWGKGQEVHDRRYTTGGTRQEVQVRRYRSGGTRQEIHDRRYATGGLR